MRSLLTSSSRQVLVDASAYFAIAYSKDHNWATSFSVMERLGIQHAFTFDRNFAQYGWTVLVP